MNENKLKPYKNYILVVTSLIVAAIFILATKSYLDGLRIEVYENEFAVVTRLGDIKQTIDKPGNYFYIPYIDRFYFYNLEEHESSAYTERYITNDKRFIEAEYIFHWRIKSPLIFHNYIGDSLAGDEIVELINTLYSTVVAREMREVVTDYTVSQIGPIEGFSKVSNEEIEFHINNQFSDRLLSARSREWLNEGGIEITKVSVKFTYTKKF